MFDAHAQKYILIVMLQIFDNLFHYKNILTVQWIKRLKLCMVTMATLPIKNTGSVLAVWDTNTRCPQKSDMCMLFCLFLIQNCVMSDSICHNMLWAQHKDKEQDMFGAWLFESSVTIF